VRALLATLVVLVVLAVAGVLVGGLVASDLTETTIANRIEARVPGSHATVNIQSQPYLVKLAASGRVDQLHAHVTNVTEQGVTVRTVDVDVNAIRVNRNDLFSGEVRLMGIGQATVTATVTPSEVAAAAGADAASQLAGLASGTSASVHANPNGIDVGIGSVAVRIPYDPLVTCAGSAVWTGGNLVLSCTTSSLPPAISQQVDTRA
jgi:hypothetical protein